MAKKKSEDLVNIVEQIVNSFEGDVNFSAFIDRINELANRKKGSGVFSAKNKENFLNNFSQLSEQEQSNFIETLDTAYEQVSRKTTENYKNKKLLDNIRNLIQPKEEKTEREGEHTQEEYSEEITEKAKTYLEDLLLLDPSEPSEKDKLNEIKNFYDQNGNQIQSKTRKLLEQRLTDKGVFGQDQEESSKRETGTKRRALGRGLDYINSSVGMVPKAILSESENENAGIGYISENASIDEVEKPVVTNEDIQQRADEYISIARDIVESVKTKKVITPETEQNIEEIDSFFSKHESEISEDRMTKINELAGIYNNIVKQDRVSVNNGEVNGYEQPVEHLGILEQDAGEFVSEAEKEPVVDMSAFEVSPDGTSTSVVAEEEETYTSSDQDGQHIAQTGSLAGAVITHEPMISDSQALMYISDNRETQKLPEDTRIGIGRDFYNYFDGVSKIAREEIEFDEEYVKKAEEFFGRNFSHIDRAYGLDFYADLQKAKSKGKVSAIGDKSNEVQSIVGAKIPVDHSASRNIIADEGNVGNMDSLEREAYERSQVLADNNHSEEQQVVTSGRGLTQGRIDLSNIPDNMSIEEYYAQKQFEDNLRSFGKGVKPVTDEEKPVEKTEQTRAEEEKPSEKKDPKVTGTALVPVKTEPTKEKFLLQAKKETTILAEPKKPWYKRLAGFTARHPVITTLIGTGIGVGVGLATAGIGLGAGMITSIVSSFPTVAIASGAGLAAGILTAGVSQAIPAGRREYLYSKFRKQYNKCQKISESQKTYEEIQTKAEAKKEEFKQKNREQKGILKSLGVYKAARDISKFIERHSRKMSRQKTQEYSNNVDKALETKVKLNAKEVNAGKTKALAGYLEKKRKLDKKLESGKIEQEDYAEDLKDMEEDMVDLGGEAGLRDNNIQQRTYDKEAWTLIESVKGERSKTMTAVLDAIAEKNSEPDDKKYYEYEVTYDDKKVENEIQALIAAGNKEKAEALKKQLIIQQNNRARRIEETKILREKAKADNAKIVKGEIPDDRDMESL